MSAILTNPTTWVAVAFILVVGFAARPVLRMAGTSLDQRAEAIRTRIDEAVRLREEAQDMLATYQRKQRDAMKEAEDIIARARAEAERVAEQASKDLEASLARREQQAMDRIAQAEAQAMKEVRNKAIDLAMDATRAVLADKLGAKGQSALIDDAINNLPNKLH